LQTSRIFPEFEPNGPGSSGTVYEYWSMCMFVFYVFNIEWKN
jgi:hypothetical protein